MLIEQAGRLTPTERYAEQKRYFARFDALLDGETTGPLWLRESQVAAVLTEALLHRHGRAYELLGYCLMPNHVHLVVQLPPNAPSFVRTLQSLKSFTAGQINRILGRAGQVWH